MRLTWPRLPHKDESLPREVNGSFQDVIDNWTYVRHVDCPDTVRQAD